MIPYIKHVQITALSSLLVQTTIAHPHLWVWTKRCTQHFFRKMTILYFIPYQAFHGLLSICSGVENKQHKQVHNL